MTKLATVLHWNEILEEIAADETARQSNNKLLSIRAMRRDVPTHWRSTYNLLNFAYSNHDAVEKITSKHALNLKEYKLSGSEWEIVKQLHDSF